MEDGLKCDVCGETKPPKLIAQQTEHTVLCADCLLLAQERERMVAEGCPHDAAPDPVS